MAVTLSTLLLSFLERLQQTAFKTFMKSAIPHLLPWLQHRVVTVHGATARSEIPLRNHRDSDTQLSLVRGLADVLLSRCRHNHEPDLWWSRSLIANKGINRKRGNSNHRNRAKQIEAFAFWWWWCEGFREGNWEWKGWRRDGSRGASRKRKYTEKTYY